MLYALRATQWTHTIHMQYVAIPVLVMFTELPSDHWACCYSTAVEVPQYSDNVTK